MKMRRNAMKKDRVIDGIAMTVTKKRLIMRQLTIHQNTRSETEEKLVVVTGEEDEMINTTKIETVAIIEETTTK